MGRFYVLLAGLGHKQVILIEVVNPVHLLDYRRHRIGNGYIDIPCQVRSAFPVHIPSNSIH